MAWRLRARLKDSRAGTHLADAAMPPVKGHPEQRAADSGECHTPAGLPIRVRAHFIGDWGEITVFSAEAKLLSLSSHVNCHAELLLPTEETLTVSVESR